MAHPREFRNRQNREILKDIDTSWKPWYMTLYKLGELTPKIMVNEVHSWGTSSAVTSF